MRGEATTPAFDIGDCLKDLRAIVAVAGAMQAVAGGWSNRDVAAVALYSASLKSPASNAAK